ncbi:MAG: ABC transporter ATP-binding protein [Chitinophagales bacterium]
MKITISSAGKRFNYEWILKNIHYTFQSGNSYAILGPNGSGKSTLLQMISGMLTPSSGSINYEHNSTNIEAEDIFRLLSIAAPYLELVEEFTMEELFLFQQQFKPLHNGITIAEAMDITRLKPDPLKQIRNFSSGMKQRLKVALAVLADVPVVLLDEPTTNLDESGVEWYLDLMKKYSGDRLIIICSNVSREYQFCTEQLDVVLFK